MLSVPFSGYLLYNEWSAHNGGGGTIHQSSRSIIGGDSDSELGKVCRTPEQLGLCLALSFMSYPQGRESPAQLSRFLPPRLPVFPLCVSSAVNGVASHPQSCRCGASSSPPPPTPSLQPIDQQIWSILPPKYFWNPAPAPSSSRPSGPLMREFSTAFIPGHQPVPPSPSGISRPSFFPSLSFFR